MTMKKDKKENESWEVIFYFESGDNLEGIMTFASFEQASEYANFHVSVIKFEDNVDRVVIKKQEKEIGVDY